MSIGDTSPPLTPTGHTRRHGAAARVARLLTVAVVAAPAVVLPAAAHAVPAGAPAAASAGPVSPARSMEQALERDLKLSPAAARTRRTAEAAAGRSETAVRAELGHRFAGAWFDATRSRLVVAVTDERAAAAARAAGVDARLATYAEADLTAAQQRFTTARVPAGVRSVYVDVRANTLVVVTAPGTRKAVEQVARAAGVDTRMLRVDVSAETAQPVAAFDVVGADAYTFPTSQGAARCSIGFAVEGGYVTAGHCGGVSTVTSSGGRRLGVVRGSTFPSKDYAWVAVDTPWSPVPFVNQYAVGQLNVRGATEAPVGASVCRSGSTTGWHCGVISRKNETVYYGQGAVAGLTTTTACAEPGDSGGPYVAGDQAQGVASGIRTGTSCSTPSTAVSYFQPLAPILTAYNLKLVTGYARRKAFGVYESAARVPGGVRVYGWAIDADYYGGINVQVQVDGRWATTVAAGIARGDVGAAYPGLGSNHGFDTVIPSSVLSEGAHTICVNAMSYGYDGDNPSLGCKTVTVGVLPIGVVESAARVSGGVQIGGWTLDPDSTASLAVHVYVDGAFAAGFTANVSRNDVAAAYPGYGAYHGFSGLVPVGAGTHQVCVYALNVGAGTVQPQLGCRTIS